MMFPSRASSVSFLKEWKKKPIVRSSGTRKSATSATTSSMSRHRCWRLRRARLARATSASSEEISTPITLRNGRFAAWWRTRPFPQPKSTNTSWSETPRCRRARGSECQADGMIVLGKLDVARGVETTTEQPVGRPLQVESNPQSRMARPPLRGGGSFLASIGLLVLRSPALERLPSSARGIRRPAHAREATRPRGRWLVAHRWKEQHFPQALRPCQDHHQPVDSEPDPTGWGQPLLERLDVDLVVGLGLLVAPGGLLRLRLEAAALLVRVVQLCERVRDLNAADERLPAFHQPRLAAMPLREGRELHRVVEDEGRLDQPGLNLLREQAVDQLSPALLRVRLGSHRLRELLP